MSTIADAWVAVPDADGLDAWEIYPASPNGQALVVLHEIFGVNTAIRRIAGNFAAQGYHVLVPDLFWRVAPHLELGYDADTMARALALAAGLDEEKAVSDIAATVALAGQRAACVHLVGFCMGGKLAVRAASIPGVSSAISFYGVGIDEIPESLAQARCPVMLHYGASDPYIPMSAVEAVQAASAGLSYVTLHIYPGAGHGFFSPSRALHHPEAARLAWERCERLFHQVAAASPHSAPRR